MGSGVTVRMHEFAIDDFSILRPDAIERRTRIGSFGDEGDGLSFEIGASTEYGDCQLRTRIGNNEVDRVRQWILESKIKETISNCCIAAGRNIV